MNKPVVVTIAVVVLLLAVLSWAYLFFFGTPRSTGDVFTDLGIVPVSDPTLVPLTEPTTDADRPTVDVSSEALQQLTVRPVAGYQALAGAVRYVEQGTGHVYEIDLASGNETRLSNTTVPIVTKAYSNEAGNAFVLLSQPNETRSVLVATLTDSSLTTTSLPPNAQNIAFSDNNTIFYTRATTAGTVGYEYTIDTTTQRELFQAPLLQVNAELVDGEAFLIPRVANTLEGTLFTANGTDLTINGTSEFGLVTEVFNDQWYARGFIKNETLLSEVVARDTNTTFSLPVMFIPEKCAWRSTKLWCAAPIQNPTSNFVSNWYTGIVQSNDVLWEITPTLSEARLLINPEQITGRPLDITAVTVTSSNILFFTNRTDNTLWLYDANQDR